MMGLVLAVTVIGLKIVGLDPDRRAAHHPVGDGPVLDRAERVGVVAIAGRRWRRVSGYVGAALSASAPQPADGTDHRARLLRAFLASLLLAPSRGVLAALLRHRRFQVQVHRRQGLLALAHGEPIFDPFTISVLRRDGLIRDGWRCDRRGQGAGRQGACATRDAGRSRARSTRMRPSSGRYDGLTPIETVLTQDEIADIDRRIGGPRRWEEG